MDSARTDTDPRTVQPPGHAALRQDLQRRVHHYLNLPVALASILFVLVAFTQFSNTGYVPWHRRFWHGPPAVMLWGIWVFFVGEFLAKFALAPRKAAYLRGHWLDALVALVPATGVLRLLDALIVSPLVRLLRGHREHPHLAILLKRKLGKLALISVLVILIAAVLEYIAESGARGSTIQTFGDALWWAAATATTVANQLYPVTAAGELVGFALMLYAVAVFAYLASSFASALIGGDAQQAAEDSAATAQAAQASPPDAGAAPQAPAPPPQDGVGQPPPNGHLALTPDEIAVLRRLLDRVQTPHQ